MGKIDDICGTMLTRPADRRAVAEALERGLRKKYDYDKLKDRIRDIVKDKDRASKITTAIVEAYPQFRKRAAKFEEDDGMRIKRDRRDEKRSDHRDGRDNRENRENRDRDRNGDRNGRQDKEKEREKSRPDDRQKRETYLKRLQEEEEGKKRPPTNAQLSSVTEDQLRAKELLYKAQQEIEEKKRQLAVSQGTMAPITAIESAVAPMPGKNLALRPQEAMVFMKYSLDKKSRVEELKAKLAKTAIAQKLSEIPVAKEGMVPLQEIITAKVDKKVQQLITKETQVEEKKEERKHDRLLEYLDPRISTRPSERKNRRFEFHEKGEFEKLANKQRAMAKLERLQAEVSTVAKSTGISSAVKLAMVTPAGASSKVDGEVPDIEPWDLVVLNRLDMDVIPDVTDPTRYAETISELVEHPISLRPPTEPLVPQYLTVYLTTKEKKKIRRQNRKEALKEKSEKVRLGLEPPPEPKIKIGNLMRVLGNEAVQDPTKMEAHVRKQMAARLQKHEDENAQRKLTNEEKAAKKTKKLSEDTSLSVHVAIYKMKSLLNLSKKFKVETNARQLQMTGVVMTNKLQNVVVVEGGPKQQRFYKNLMLNRIKWTDEIIGKKKEAEKDEEGERNSCELVWEGQVKRRNFRDFTFHNATLEKQAREFFEKHSVAQYWDLCYSTTVLLEGQDTLPSC